MLESCWDVPERRPSMDTLSRFFATLTVVEAIEVGDSRILEGVE